MEGSGGGGGVEKRKYRGEAGGEWNTTLWENGLSERALPWGECERKGGVGGRGGVKAGRWAVGLMCGKPGSYFTRIQRRAVSATATAAISSFIERQLVVVDCAD